MCVVQHEGDGQNLTSVSAALCGVGVGLHCFAQQRAACDELSDLCALQLVCI
jgi:hypothetical protein